ARVREQAPEPVEACVSSSVKVHRDQSRGSYKVRPGDQGSFMIAMLMLSALLQEAGLQDDSSRGLGVARWIEADQPPQGLHNDVFFLDEKTGWAVGADGRVSRSTDGGCRWTELKPPGKDQFWNGV